LSTRAEITATRFTIEYHWGSFRGDPEKMMASYTARAWTISPAGPKPPGQKPRT